MAKYKGKKFESQVTKEADHIYKIELKEKKRDKPKHIFLLKWYFIIMAILLSLFLILRTKLMLLVLIAYFSITVLSFVVYELVNCISMMLKEGTDTEKYALWLVIILLFPPIGALLYWASRHEPKPL